MIDPSPDIPGLDPPITAKILIVDDDERNAFAARHALISLGHELVVAHSGEEALKKLLVDDYAIILLDLHMPGMDGYETAALIRARRRNSRIPILFLTAVFRDEAHLFQAYTAGAVDVVFKPVDPFILRSKVSVLMDLHLKTTELKQQADHHKRLLEENIRVRKEKDLAQRTIERMRARQDAILRALPIIVLSRRCAAPFAPLFLSDKVEQVTGFPDAAFMSDPAFGFSRVHPDDQARVMKALDGALVTGGYGVEFRWLHADGTYRVFLDQGVLSGPGEGGHPEIVGAMLDVTDRRSLEEQLAQARKMEAVGQLTGGIAHDFNNLLTVILGNIDLMTRKAGDEAKRERQLEAMRTAADRGRSLTRQLLAFSRRQQLNPQTLDVNTLISDFLPLVRQAVGEAITVHTHLSKRKLCADIDPTQLEAALLNLAVNARDAMPNGGDLTIATRPATRRHDLPKDEPETDKAHWILVEVTDTGPGMDAAVLERIFEPFFTTKEVGKGSGLGLSQVYGFVHQSGGHVSADSSEGQGARFRLHLRISEAKPAERAAAKTPKRLEPGRERVLVVEDDVGVLALNTEMLEGLGYTVETACDARRALSVLESGEPFDMLFSDVVMPGGMSGVELAREVRRTRPDIAVLLASGFVADETVFTQSEFPLIEKPYERAALAAKLREVLDGKRKPSRAPRARPSGKLSAEAAP